MIEPFGALTRARRAEATAEAARLLAALHPEHPYDIRFGALRS
jgi:hypothetical protein